MSRKLELTDGEALVLEVILSLYAQNNENLVKEWGDFPEGYGAKQVKETVHKILGKVRS